MSSKQKKTSNFLFFFGKRKEQLRKKPEKLSGEKNVILLFHK